MLEACDRVARRDDSVSTRKIELRVCIEVLFDRYWMLVASRACRHLCVIAGVAFERR